MRGNFHAQFLGEGIRGNTIPLPDNLTSQFWANVYLNPLDQFVKHGLRCHGYVRYVDDFVLFSQDKDQLHEWREEIITFLQSLRLTIHANRAQVCPVTQGIPFLGFTVFPTHPRLKRSKGIRYQRHVRGLVKAYRQGQLARHEVVHSLQAWLGHVQHGDTWHLRHCLYAQITKPAEAF